jgi:hypothetical protein
MRAGPTEKM